jgi:hypothetical protein
LCTQAQTNTLRLERLLAESEARTSRAARERENTMDAFKIIFTVFVLRLVLPVGLLLLVGEQLAKHNRARQYRR